MRQMWEKEPLALVRASAESGNVLILTDCNIFGETAHDPAHRICPMGKYLSNDHF